MKPLWILEKILDKLLKIENFQNYVNNKYNVKGFNHHIRDDILEGSYYFYDGFAFNVTDQILSIFEVVRDYKYTDINSTDIVLDIGANIGAFSILVSNKAKHVYAVEPIFSDTINKNLLKNNIKNVTVLEMGLGVGEQNISYGTYNKTIKCHTLTDLIQLCAGHIDFLKCDCEGGEWCIKPEELKGIRRIEMEVHCSRERIHQFENMLKEAGFEYKTKNYNSLNLHIIHAKRRIL